jgi:uncharacterized protein YdaL
MITARNTSIAKAIALVKYRNAASLAKGIATVKIRNSANVLKTVFSQGGTLIIDVPPSAYGAQSVNETVPITTEVITATVTGGASPITYLWEAVNLFGNSWTIISPNSTSTSFRANAVGSGNIQSAIFKCTATDSRGRTVESINVDVTAENYGGFA